MKPGETYAKLFDHSHKLATAYLKGFQTLLQSQQVVYDNLREIALVSRKIFDWQRSHQSSQLLMQEEISLFKDYYQLYLHLFEKLLDKNIPPFIEPSAEDKRFKSPYWNDNFWFYSCQQSFLLFSKHMTEYIQNNPLENEKINEQVLFFSKQFLNALSPSNYLLTNPEVYLKTIEQGGANLFHGFEQMLTDLQQGQGYFIPLMVDINAFGVGKNLAMTPGKIVFKNKVIELIQYSPSTEKVYEIPLLIVPPWINKYYILDLRPENSLVKWLVDKGHTVFMISWVNPDESYKDVSFEDYMLMGLLPAIETINKITQVNKINALGFCIGGTLLAITIAYLHAKGVRHINSATFLATLLDFERPGDLGLMVDESQLSLLKHTIGIKGYLDGRLLMGIFNSLRANELFWPYFINNYLLGKPPYAFDLLYWNQDPSNLPAKMACEYLEDLYLDNRLVKESLSWDSVTLSLSKIDIPCYFLATERDHIAPWIASFNGAKRVKGDLTFVLGGSGHIAGIINPPKSSKYGYHIGHEDAKSFPTAASWLYAATRQEGSWWVHWQQWLSQLSGEFINARLLKQDLPNAPGENVKKKINKS
ncbi:MAG: PHA/PHB synthase family protein [Candidatus Berkiella sp.]